MRSTRRPVHVGGPGRGTALRTLGTGGAVRGARCSCHGSNTEPHNPEQQRAHRALAAAASAASSAGAPTPLHTAGNAQHREAPRTSPTHRRRTSLSGCILGGARVVVDITTFRKPRDQCFTKIQGARTKIESNDCSIAHSLHILKKEDYWCCNWEMSDSSCRFSCTDSCMPGRGLWDCGGVGRRGCWSVGLWECGAVGLWGLWGCGGVGLWECGAVGLWGLWGCVGLWGCGAVSLSIQLQFRRLQPVH